MGDHNHHHPHDHAHGHTHDHGHDHAHDHTHAHDHSHDGDSYYLDQLCMTGLSGAFGVIALTMYFWRSDMLYLLLGPQFHPFVLASGVALLLVAVVRAVNLWVVSGQSAHEHHHHHDHAHGECGHAHAHGDCGHDHAHAHAHAHAHHHHDHSHDDHDHGWAPWRYVVLLLPILLFMLGLPNKGPSITTGDTTKVDTTADAMKYGTLVSLGPSVFAQSAVANELLSNAVGTATPVNYKTLEGAAGTADLRRQWKGETVEVRGQFSPNPQNPNVFSLVRFRISCCANDSIQLNVPMVCRDAVTDLKTGDWIKVAGRIDFLEQNGAYRTLVRIPARDAIKKADPDPNPYIQ